MKRRIKSVALVWLALATTLLVGATGAQAIVVDMNAVGKSTVPFNSYDQGGYYGVALTPGSCTDMLTDGTCNGLAHKGIPRVTLSGPCDDPALTPDLTLPDTGICLHPQNGQVDGGQVMPSNETFALTWDADRSYWAGTRGYVEQFLRDVADGTGTLTSPYAVTTQYHGSNGRAQNSSKYGGGCIDYGNGGSCDFTSWNGSGHTFEPNGCRPSGDSFTSLSSVGDNDVCLTDAQLQGELSAMIDQTGVVGRTQPRYTPLVTLLLPPGVEACLDPTGRLCSANGSLTPPPSMVTVNATGGELASGAYDVETTYVTPAGEDLPGASQIVTASGSTSSISLSSPPAANGAIGWYAYVKGPGASGFTRVQRAPTPIGLPVSVAVEPNSGPTPPHPPFFCSYHSQVRVDHTEVAYLVQPWTAMTGCDEPDAPALPVDPTPDELATNIGVRLVSPLSQAHIASIVNPGLNGWFALDGSEINDNDGCVPLAGGLDSVTVGSSSQNPYLLQREFNNAGVMEFDPNTYFGCAPNVLLTPHFVVPSAIDQGDEVQLDGSVTASTLMVPASGYEWDFGDGTPKEPGPAVVHVYAQTGTYSVKLTVTDRGGNVQSLTQTIAVLGPNGEAPPSPPAPGTSPGSAPPPAGGSGPGSNSGPGPGSGGGPPPPPHPTLKAHLQLMPQGLRTMLVRGLALKVTSSEAADGLATLSIPRAAAKRAHIKAGRGPSVVVARGTIAGITEGTTSLRLQLSRAVVAKLERLHHVVMTIRLSLVAAGDRHVAIDVAGHY